MATQQPLSFFKTNRRIVFCALVVLLLAQFQLLRAESNSSTDQLIKARLFEESLVWARVTPPDSIESSELWNVFGVGRLKHLDEAFSGVEVFIKAHPDSVWIPLLNGNLGRYYRDHGFFLLALEHSPKGWNATKGRADAGSRQVADCALISLLSNGDGISDYREYSSGDNLCNSVEIHWRSYDISLKVMITRPRNRTTCFDN